MNRIWLLVALLWGCKGPAQGTSIGNPTKMTLRVAASTDVQLTEALFPPGELWFSYRDGTEASVELPDPTDLLTGAPIEVPNGEWEGMAIELDDPFEMAGTTRSGDPATLTIDLPDFRLDPRSGFVVFDRGAFVLELAAPGWLDETEVGYDVDATVLVEPGDSFHDGLARAIAEDSGLFDDDGDRRIDDDERDRGQEAGATRPR